jgi:Transposase DDE domain
MPTSSHPSRAKLQTEVREWFPSLSRAQANVLGEMAYAMLMTDGCGMTRMSSYMAELLGQPMNTLRQKYREIYYEKEAKAGVKNRQKKRREIVPEELFADLLRGVLKGWEGEKTLVLALDASALADRFTVLSISVMYRGCGMRVAWTVQEGHQAGEWRPHWERMLKQLADVVPADWTVLVMADRGLYAAWLYQAIQANGWHPFLRVKKDLSFRAQGEEVFGSIGGRVQRMGREWKGSGEWSEKGDRMGGTVLVRWEQGYEEAICVVSDLSPEKARTAWYQMRFWIEDEYKDGKRGWFHWEQTKMTNPQRASRLWLVLGIVLQKAIVLGGQLEAEEQQARHRSKRRQSSPKRRRGRPALPQGRPRGREQSVLLRGIMALRAAESGGKRLLPNGQVRAEPLPSRLHAVRRVCKSYQMKKKRREEKKRNKQRAQARARREQRAQEWAAKQAAIQARRLEKHEQRVAKPVAIQAHREKRKAPGPPVHQSAPCSQRREAQAESKGSQTSQVSPVRIPNLVAKRTEAVPLLRWRDGRLQPPGKQEPPPLGHPGVSLSQPHPLTAQRPPREAPLLRLSGGRLQPPQRLVRKEIRLKRDHGPPPQAGP